MVVQSIDYDSFAAAYAAENENNVVNAYYERPAKLALARDVAGPPHARRRCGSGSLAARCATEAPSFDMPGFGRGGLPISHDAWSRSPRAAWVDGRGVRREHRQDHRLRPQTGAHLLAAQRHRQAGLQAQRQRGGSDRIGSKGCSSMVSLTISAVPADTSR